MSRKKIESFKYRFRQYIYKAKHDFLATENVILIIAAVICLVLTGNIINSMTRNWTLTEELAKQNQAQNLLRIEIETAELENEYYKSSEYQELAARKLADKQLPGEHMVVMPNNSESAKNKHANMKKNEEPIVQKTNLEKWISFLFPSY